MAEYRVQDVDGERSLEITTTVPQKEQISEKRLLEQKAYFEEMIANGQYGLDDVNTKLAMINDEADSRKF